MNDVPQDRAGRSIGAMVLIFFGTAWLVAWSMLRWPTTARRTASLLSIGIFAAALLVGAVHARRADRAALRSQSSREYWRSVRRPFHLINAAQWVLIIVLANILGYVGLAAWIIPMIILVVGVHFLPLARIFAFRLYYATGAAMIVLAVCYPLLARHGPSDPIGCLLSGVILWATGLYMLRASAPVSQRTPAEGERST